ncbi:MAG: hypothetical protein EB117_14350 [Betaproteobacteria bacterium]|nr:hypothetical protein [Betaproteobacteria bacterium]
MTTATFTKGQIVHGVKVGIFSVVKTQQAGSMTIVTVREVHPTTGELTKFTMRFPIEMFREYAA